MSETKILGSYWFTSMGGLNFGVVLTNNGYEDKAHIGHNVTDEDQKEAEEHIASFGAKFPADVARQLIFPNTFIGWTAFHRQIDQATARWIEEGKYSDIRLPSHITLMDFLNYTSKKKEEE